MRSLGGQRVVFTRLGGLRIGMRVRAANRVVFAVSGGAAVDQRLLAFEG